jgi:hypothetical protein
MTSDWATPDVYCLAPLLVRLARLSNEVMDHDSADPEDYVTFREMGLRLVGRLDLTDAWLSLTESVLALDAFLADPAASDGWQTEDDVRDSVDLDLWCLLHPGLAPCPVCRALQGGRDEMQAVVHWQAMGACSRHETPVTNDPWAWALAGAA